MERVNSGSVAVQVRNRTASRALQALPVAVAALSLLAGSGCKSSLETGLFAISRVKSPITYDLRHVELNKPLAETFRAELEKARAGLPAEPITTNVLGKAERIDDLADLAAKDTLVMVCYSGGGARAARMAMHAMAELEAVYNKRHDESATPLIDRIDAYSTVSGGSIYSSLVAAGFHTAQSTNTMKERRNGFQSLPGNRRAGLITSNLGSSSALYYFNPGHFGVVPALLTVTEWDTLNLFARTHAYVQQNRFLFTPPQKLMTLADLNRSPRFLFNATCVETRMPFVITQSALHHESDANPLTGVTYNPARDWFLETSLSYSRELLRNPLVHASTLEDIGSSPGAFPLSYAAMASAAFPFIFNPLHLKKHNVTEDEDEDSYVRLIDGGIYDNTGIVTALELFSHFETRHPNPNRKLVLISINADNVIGGFDKKSLAKIGFFELDIPLRGAYEAVQSMNQVYYHQTQLFRAAIQRRVKELNFERPRVEFFDINLEDLKADKQLREDVQQIKTAMVISRKNDLLMKRAVEEIMKTPREDLKMSLADAIVEKIGDTGR